MKPEGIVALLTGLAILIAAVGCATPNPPMYYFGDYSNSLYHAKKTPGPESIAEHSAVLEKIIEESKERNLRVPPGISAELGYLYALQNNNKKAIELFNLEKQTYPEASILMDRLILRSETKAKPDNTPDAQTQTVSDKPREAPGAKVKAEEKAK
jgi:hypothetical protein